MTSQRDRTRRIATGLSRIALALRGMAWKRATAEAVTPTQGDILEHLADASAPMRLGELADALAITAPTASDAVSALVKKNLAEKLAGTDKRSISIRLTSSGRSFTERTQDWSDHLLTAIATLSTKEQAAMLRGLSKLIASLQDDGAISAQRLCVTCTHFRPFAHADEAKPHHCALIDRAYGDLGLQLNCPDHEPTPDSEKVGLRRRFNAPPSI
jgi:DNA-binding MarR family transcriptional regulator